VDQGGGKRKGSFAMNLEPWHGDIFDSLELKNNHGKEEQRARDVLDGLLIPTPITRHVDSESRRWVAPRASARLAMLRYRSWSIHLRLIVPPTSSAPILTPTCL
jgi:hypothetical protein